jgi:Alternate to MurJ
LLLAVILVAYAFATALQMGTHAARLSGVRTKRVATGLTLFNLFGTTGRFLSLFYMPLIGSLADHARAANAPGNFAWDMRATMFAATAGTLLGGLAIPWATRLLERGIASFERRGSLLAAIAQPFKPRTFLSVFSDFRLPTPTMLRYSPAPLPKGFLWWNIVVMAFWVAGPLASYFAGVLTPKFAITAVSLSGLITGVSTLTLTYIVDPTAALITDQAATGVRPESDLKAAILYLVITAAVGTLLAQALLEPAAQLIAYAAGVLNSAHLHI